MTTPRTLFAAFSVGRLAAVAAPAIAALATLAVAPAHPTVNVSARVYREQSADGTRPLVLLILCGFNEPSHRPCPTIVKSITLPAEEVTDVTFSQLREAHSLYESAARASDPEQLTIEDLGADSGRQRWRLRFGSALRAAESFRVTGRILGDLLPQELAFEDSWGESLQELLQCAKDPSAGQGPSATSSAIVCTEQVPGRTRIALAAIQNLVAGLYSIFADGARSPPRGSR